MEKDFLQLVAKILTVIGIGFLLFFLASCYTQKKAYKQVAKADYYYPEVVQQFCNDTVITRTVKGDTVTITQPGKQIDCDTVTIYQTINSKGKIVECPPTKTHYLTDTVYVADADKLKAAQHQISLCNEQKNKAQGQKKTLQNALIASAILNVILAAFCGLMIRFKGMF